MPTRNCAPYLAEAIDSVLSQSAADLELVLYDDASDDDTAAIARSFRDRRMRYFRHAGHQGIPATRNSCLRAARGRFVAWLDSDDRFLPEAIAHLLAAIEQHPGVGLAHGAFKVIAADGRPLPDWPMPFDENVVEDGQAAFRELVVLNYITAPVLVRRECHDRVGPYATDIGPGSTDWEMWLRLVLHTDVAYVARPLAEYRQHPQSITAAAHRPGTRLRCDAAAVARVFSRHRDTIPDADALEAQARLALLAKALLFARDAIARLDWTLAAGAVAAHIGAVSVSSAGAEAVLSALDERNELRFHRQSRTLLGEIQRVLSATRMGPRLSRVAVTDDSWERTLESIAALVRAVVPDTACIAVVDKWDPTLIHLTGRTGCHFPDRRSMPDGYPADSERAIAHLEDLRQRGVSYLVFPSAAFWWLQHYEAFAAHLAARYRRVWHDAQCVIYSLSANATTGDTLNPTRRPGEIDTSGRRIGGQWA
jgi:Glycosyl transferase family 2